MLRSQPTIHDIAKELNVSPSTVSRALKDHPRISKRTKAAVKEVAHRINYKHNNIASALRAGKSYMLGVIIPTANRTFFGNVLRGIEQVASQNGYNVLITQSNDLVETEIKNIDTLLQAHVDGVILSIAKSTQNLDHLKRVKASGLPLVLFDRINENLGASTVVIDDYQGAYTATRHLIEQGCRRIAHFTGPKHINIYKYRLSGYREALADAGLPFDQELVLQSQDLRLEDGRRHMQELLEKGMGVDGLFAASDYSAMGAIQVCKEHSISVPSDLAVVGFMNEPFTEFVEPGLSTIDQCSEEMGRLAAEIFLEQIEKGKDYTLRQSVLMPKLIQRTSSLKNKIV
ncbi:MAG: LacI family DNA-binding transcriptional regulator [Bacteroidota bacterium]